MSLTRNIARFFRVLERLAEQVVLTITAFRNFCFTIPKNRVDRNGWLLLMTMWSCIFLVLSYGVFLRR